MRLRVLASVWVVGLLLSGVGVAQDINNYSYLFPRFTHTLGSEIKIVNLGTTVAQAEVEYFTEEGLATGKFLTILPATQASVTAAEIGANATGSVRVRTSALLEVSALLVEEGGSLEIAEPTAPGSTIIIPFAHGSRGKTFLDIFNSGST
jgi:hypothetical protein